MLHKLLSLIALAILLLAGPAVAQTAVQSAVAPAAKAAPAANAVTADQARRALDTLQDDAKRAR